MKNASRVCCVLAQSFCDFNAVAQWCSDAALDVGCIQVGPRLKNTSAMVFTCDVLMKAVTLRKDMQYRGRI